jgi:hypothetical protein
MLSQLNAALPQIALAPKTDAVISCLCLRPDRGTREFPERLVLTQAQGVIGDRWLTTAWLTLPDGSPDPRVQVSILPQRVLDLVWTDRENSVHPGDQIVADLDMSEENLPIGTLIRAGSAVLRVSDEPNYGCVKWKARYGADALKWVESHPALRLRGVLCSVEQDGVVTLQDRLQVLHIPSSR